MIISVLAVFPDLISTKVARLLGFKSNINAVIFLAMGFLFVLVIYLTAIVEKLERQVTVVVREFAIENQLLKEALREGENDKNEDSHSS